MPYLLALQQPESPIREDWAWISDITEAYDGSESGDPLTRYPRRTFSGQLAFSDVEHVRRHQAFMFHALRDEIGLPLYQYQTKLKAPALAGSDTVQVNNLRGDLREGRSALLIEGDTYQLLTVLAMDAVSVTFVELLGSNYSPRALLMPVTGAFSTRGASFSRRNPDDSATSSFTYTEASPWTPLVSPLNAEVLTFFDGMAVLDRPAIGTQFDRNLDNGMRVTDYTAEPDFFSPWTQSQWTFPARYLANRVHDNASWLWWSVFADHLQGSSTPFLVPTWRADLDIVAPAAGGGNTLVVTGHEYSEHYADHDTFQRLVIDTDAGTQYVKVTAVVDAAGNDQITFAPALPAGAGWATNQKVSFLQRVRIADDRISCEHYGQHTEVSLALRTV